MAAAVLFFLSLDCEDRVSIGAPVPAHILCQWIVLAYNSSPALREDVRRLAVFLLSGKHSFISSKGQGSSNCDR